MNPSEIDSELRSLLHHQKVLMEVEQVLRRIAAARVSRETRIASALLDLEQRINRVERRIQMLLIEAAKDDDLQRHRL